MKLGPFMMRVHRVLTADLTPFLHTHPFAYISIILRGGYTEQVLKADGTLHVQVHTRGSIIFRSAKTAHRIIAVEPRCTTLFLAWRTAPRHEQGWELIRHPKIKAPKEYIDAPDGVYAFLNGFRRRHKGMWYALRDTPAEAEMCSTLSIHQNLLP